MTDLERFLALYKSFGIDCVVKERGEYKIITLCAYETFPDDVETINKRLNGRQDHFSEVVFNLYGKFVEQTFRSLD